MSITTQQTVVLADVGSTDDYRVAVTVDEGFVILTTTQAREHAADLIRLADEMDRAREVDYPEPATDGRERLAHGFDLAPACRDCKEGKHAACIGSAWVENGPDIDEVDCQCDLAGHPKSAGAL